MAENKRRTFFDRLLKNRGTRDADDIKQEQTQATGDNKRTMIEDLKDGPVNESLSSEFNELVKDIDRERELEEKEIYTREEYQRLKNETVEEKVNDTFTKSTNGLGEVKFRMNEDDKKYMTYCKYWCDSMEYFYYPMLYEKRKEYFGEGENNSHKQIDVVPIVPEPRSEAEAEKMHVIVSRLKSFNNTMLFNELFQSLEMEQNGYKIPEYYSQDKLIDHMYEICKNTTDDFFQLDYQCQSDLIVQLGHEKLSTLFSIEVKRDDNGIPDLTYCVFKNKDNPFKHEVVFEQEGGYMTANEYAGGWDGDEKEYSVSVEEEMHRICNSGKTDVEIAIECKKFFETLKPLEYMEGKTQNMLIEMNKNIDMVLMENAILVNNEWHLNAQSYEVDVNDQVEFSEEYEDRTQ